MSSDSISPSASLRPSQVNGQNVVKVGHRQVVNMIRQGGNSLMVKVVMVTRNPDMEEGTRKKSKSSSASPLEVNAVFVFFSSAPTDRLETTMLSSCLNILKVTHLAWRILFQLVVG